MLDKTVKEEVDIILADSLAENNATGGGDVHGARSKSEVIINADVVIVADNVSEVIDTLEQAKDFKDGDVKATDIDRGEP